MRALLSQATVTDVRPPVADRSKRPLAAICGESANKFRIRSSIGFELLRRRYGELRRFNTKPTNSPAEAGAPGRWCFYGKASTAGAFIRYRRTCGNAA